MVKVLAYWEFIERLDAILEKPYFLRIVKTVNYMLYLIHINACAYYAISELEGECIKNAEQREIFVRLHRNLV